MTVEFCETLHAPGYIHNNEHPKSFGDVIMCEFRGGGGRMSGPHLIMNKITTLASYFQRGPNLFNDLKTSINKFLAKIDFIATITSSNITTD